MLKKIYKATIFFSIFGIVILICLYFIIARPILFSPTMISTDIEVSEEELEKHVMKLSQDFAPRNWKNLENLNRTANYIETELRKHTNKIEIQTFTYQNKTFKNVIAKFGGGTDNLIVVGAHYDAFDDLPAADDNASGIAGLIELAYLLKKKPIRTPIHLVAYSLEEPPFFATDLMGSAVHATSLKQNNINPQLMISLEMIGYFSNEPKSQNYPSSLLKLFYPSVGDFLCIVGDLNSNSPAKEIKKHYLAATDLKVRSINAPSILPGIDFSDHRNYWHHGINAVMITDTAFYRNLNYHTPEDTHEKLNYGLMAETVKGLYSYLSQQN